MCHARSRCPDSQSTQLSSTVPRRLAEPNTHHACVHPGCRLSSLSLLSSSYPLLPLLGPRFPFETAIGTNGQVWIRAGSITQTIALGRAITEVDEGRVEVDAIGEWVDKLDGVMAE